MKKLIQSKKRLLAFAFVIALMLTALSSCSLAPKKMSDDDRAKADAVFATTEGAEEKKKAFEGLRAWYGSAERDEDGFAALPTQEDGDDQAVFIKIAENDVTIRVKGHFKASYSSDDSEKTVVCSELTLSGKVIDSSAADAAATTVPEDILSLAEGSAHIILSDSTTASDVPFKVKELSLKAATVAASKITTSDNDFGKNLSADEINAGNDAIKTAIAAITPALNRAATVYDPFADAVEYIDRTVTDSFAISQILRVPIGWILEFSFKLVGNYALALLIFAVAMKLILFPFGIMQQKSSIKQAKFAPKQKAIMKKYEGRTDQATKQKMQQEIMELQQEEGVNALGGCLPLLIQFPILFALFNVVRNPLRYMCSVPASVIQKLQVRICSLFQGGKIAPTTELLTSRYGALESIKSSIDGISAASRGELASSIASKASGVDTLSLIPNIRENFDLFSDLFSGTKVTGAQALPDFHLFGKFADLAVKPAFWNWMLLIPVLTFVIVFVTSKLTRKLTYQPPQQEGTPDMSASMKIMDYVMPLFSAYIAFVWPAIMGLYWIYQNLLGVLQQLVLKKMFPLPEFTEEDYKKAEIEILGKNPKKPKYVPNNPNASRDPSKPKSLHHIDDDDDDVPVNTPAKKTGASAAKKNPFVETGALKDAQTSAQDDLTDDDDDESDDEGEAVTTLNGEKLPVEYTKRRRGKKSHRISSRPVSESDSETPQTNSDEEE